MADQRLQLTLPLYHGRRTEALMYKIPPAYETTSEGDVRHGYRVKYSGDIPCTFIAVPTFNFGWNIVYNYLKSFKDYEQFLKVYDLTCVRDGPGMKLKFFVVVEPMGNEGISLKKYCKDDGALWDGVSLRGDYRQIIRDLLNAFNIMDGAQVEPQPDELKLDDIFIIKGRAKFLNISGDEGKSYIPRGANQLEVISYKKDSVRRNNIEAQLIMKIFHTANGGRPPTNENAYKEWTDFKAVLMGDPLSEKVRIHPLLLSNLTKYYVPSHTLAAIKVDSLDATFFDKKVYRNAFKKGFDWKKNLTGAYKTRASTMGPTISDRFNFTRNSSQHMNDKKESTIRIELEEHAILLQTMMPGHLLPIFEKLRPEQLRRLNLPS